MGMAGAGTDSGRLHPSFAANIRTHNATALSFIEPHHFLDRGDRPAFAKGTLYLYFRLVKYWSVAVGVPRSF